MKIYQVLLVDATENKIIFVAAFTDKADAEDCMKQLSPTFLGEDKSIECWEVPVQERGWDGVIRMHEEFTYSINKRNKV